MTRLLDFILAPLLDRYEATRRVLLDLSPCCDAELLHPRGWGDRADCPACGKTVTR